jgi:D-sedoheptulose 7-phosphate isomerase
MLIKSLKSGGKVIIFGNGGSAADSQHMAAELVGRFKKDRRPIGAISLTTNTSTITALANDYSYDICFSRQLEALGSRRDVAVGISTSGNSRNVNDAVTKAKSMGIKTVGISGRDGGKLAKLCDIAIVVDSTDTARIQESHLMICHIICELIERELFK